MGVIEIFNIIFTKNINSSLFHYHHGDSIPDGLIFGDIHLDREQRLVQDLLPICSLLQQCLVCEGLEYGGINQEPFGGIFGQRDSRS